MTTPDPTAFTISVRDAADGTSLSEYEIRTAISKGELSAVKRGRRILIFPADFKAWLQSFPSATDA